MLIGMLASNILPALTAQLSHQGPPRSYTMSIEEKISEWRSYMIILIGLVVASGIIGSIFMIPLQLDNIKQLLEEIAYNIKKGNWSKGRLQYTMQTNVTEHTLRNIILVGNFGFFTTYPFIKTCGLVRMCSRWTNWILLFQGFSFLAHSIVLGKKSYYLCM